MFTVTFQLNFWKVLVFLSDLLDEPWLKMLPCFPRHMPAFFSRIAFIQHSRVVQ